MLTSDSDELPLAVREAQVEAAGHGGYFSYSEYLQLKLEGYYELIRGYLLKMSSPLDAHQAIVGELFFLIKSHTRTSQCIVRDSPYDVVLFPNITDANKSKATVVQPDVCVICDETKVQRRGCFGAPDLIIEVISKKTGNKDRTTKVLLYEQAGVKEYWIVDIVQRQFEVRVLKENEYPDKPTIYPAGSIVKSAVLEGFSVSLDTVFANVIPGTEE